LVSLRGFFWNLYFCMVKYLSFHNSFFCLKILYNVKWQGHSVTHPLFKEHRLQGDKVIITLETTAKNVGYFNCTSQFLSCWELRLQNNHFEFRMSVMLPGLESDSLYSTFCPGTKRCLNCYEQVFCRITALPFKLLPLGW
jgi:hypothetical protein